MDKIDLKVLEEELAKIDPAELQALEEELAKIEPEELQALKEELAKIEQAEQLPFEKPKGKALTLEEYQKNTINLYESKKLMVKRKQGGVTFYGTSLKTWMETSHQN